MLRDKDSRRLSFADSGDVMPFGARGKRIKNTTSKLVSTNHMLDTHIYGTKLVSDIINTSYTICGFDMYEIITNYELDSNCTYQKFLARDKMYQACLHLTHNSKCDLFLKEVVKLENKEKVNAVCKYIVLFLYIDIYGIRNEKNKTSYSKW